MCDFERARLNAELLRQDITPLDMQLFASRFIWRDASERRKLAIHIWSEAAFNEVSVTRKVWRTTCHPGQKLVSSTAASCILACHQEISEAVQIKRNLFCSFSLFPYQRLERRTLPSSPKGTGATRHPRTCSNIPSSRVVPQLIDFKNCRIICKSGPGSSLTFVLPPFLPFQNYKWRRPCWRMRYDFSPSEPAFKSGTDS